MIIVVLQINFKPILAVMRQLFFWSSDSYNPMYMLRIYLRCKRLRHLGEKVPEVPGGKPWNSTPC